MNFYELMIKRSRSVEPPAPAIPTDYVLYMPFSEDRTDHSTYSRSFMLSGSEPTYGTVDNVPCAQFASGSYLRSTDLTGMAGTNHSLTFSFWYKFLSKPPHSSYRFFFDVGQGYQMQSMHFVYDTEEAENPGYVGAGIWAGGAAGFVYVDGKIVVDTEWHHVLVMYDTDSEHRFQWYQDGVLVRYSTNSFDYTYSGGGIGIGINAATYSYPIGCAYDIAGARIYYRAMTQDEITALATEFTPIKVVDFTGANATFYSGVSSSKSLTATPSGCTFSTNATVTLSMETNVGIPTDYVLYAPLHTDYTPVVGTYVGKGSNWSIDNTELAAYNSFFVDSSGDYAIKYNPSENTIYGSNPRTMSIWYKPEVSNVELNTIGYGSTGNLNCILGCIYASTKIWVEWANSWATIETGVTLDTNEWHLMTITYGGSGTTIKAYVDGVFVGETSSTLTYNTTQTNVYVGTRTYDGRPFRGWLCEARVYDRELLSAEISAIYTAGRFPSSSSSSEA